MTEAELPRRKRAAFGIGLAALAAGTLTLWAAPSTAQDAGYLKVPDGFRIEVYASGLNGPRLMTLSPNGDLFVTEPGSGRVLLLPDRNKDGRADDTLTFASGLNRPHGLAFHDGFLYVANTDAVVRFAYASGQTKASGGPQKLVDLPTGGGHNTRTIVFGPDGRMYVSSGSSCNVCEERDERRASVWTYEADGKNGKLFASGLRNAVGIEWFEGKLYATNNGRDNLGDDLPPESFYRLEGGKNYGWPYCYSLNGKQVWDRDFGRKDQTYCDKATPAFATVTAHSAPLGLAFYTGTAFASEYRGLMFVALHGSWNRSVKSGYKVVTIDPASGQVRDFVTGFLQGNEVRGRPVDLQVAPDGSLFLTDDGAGAIYRILRAG